MKKFRKEQKSLEKNSAEQKSLAQNSEVSAVPADSYTLLLAKLDRLVNTYDNINRLGDL